MRKETVYLSRRALVLGAALLVFGCGAFPTAAADLFDTVKSRGTLRIAVEGTYPPFNFRDPKTGQLSGYDVDVAHAVAAKLGVRADFITTEWVEILAGLGAGRYDVIVSQVSIRDKRERVFDFSRPYTVSSPQLILRKNERARYANLDDLKGKKLGVGQGSVFEQQARAVPGIEVKSYPSAPENLQDLAFGRVDAALNDSLMVSYLLKTSRLPIKAGPLVGSTDRIGIAMRKGSPQLKVAIDKALAELHADGSLKAMSLKWFGIDASRPAP